MWRERYGAWVAGFRPGRGSGLAGPAAGLPVLAVALVLTIPSGGAAVFMSAVLLAVGVAGAVLAWGFRIGRRAAGTWAKAAGVGVAVGVVPALAWALIGGPGWMARLAVMLGVGLWTASAGLLVPDDPRAFGWAPAVAFAGLVAFSALGYSTSAGVLYFLGPPLALAVLLAGHLASRLASDTNGTPAGLAHLAYVIAAVAMAILAWVDLS